MEQEYAPPTSTALVPYGAQPPPARPVFGRGRPAGYRPHDAFGRGQQQQQQQQYAPWAYNPVPGAPRPPPHPGRQFLPGDVPDEEEYDPNDYM